MRIKTNKAYTLIEFIIVIAVLTIISVNAFNGLNGVRQNHAIEENEAAIDLREISKQEFMLQGVIFEEDTSPFKEYGDVTFPIEKTDSGLNAIGKNNVSLLDVNFNTNRDRIKVVGKVIKNSGSPQEVTKTVLSPPVAYVSGTINLTKFPIKQFITRASDNPLGTYYRYTTDGSDPTEDSPLWTFSALRLSGWAPRMKFRAFNSDPKYTESAILEVTSTVTGDIEFKREDGTSSLKVSHTEIANGSNRIVLTVPGLGGSSDAQIQYRIQGGHNVDYSGPFHFPLEAWDSNSNELPFVVEVKIPQCHEPIAVKEFKLEIQEEILEPLKLDRPEINDDCDSPSSSEARAGIKGALYLRVEPTPLSGGYQAIDQTRKKFSIGGRNIKLSFKNIEKDFVPAKRFDPSGRYVFAGFYLNGADPTISIEMEGGKVDPAEFKIEKNGKENAILTFYGKEYAVILSFKRIEDNWMLWPNSKNKSVETYLVGIDSIKRIFKSQSK